MNSLKINLAIALLLTANFVFGQVYQRGSITYLNGDVKTGYLLIPEAPKQKTIKFKLSRNISQVDKIQSEDIKSISVESKDSNIYYFERVSVSRKPGTKPLKPYWLLVCTSGYATLYTSSSYFESDDKGNVFVVASSSSGPPTFNYFLRKGNQDIAYYFGMTGNIIGLNIMLKKNADQYLSDYPELVERIKNKEFTHRDIKAIIQIYNDYMKDNNSIQHL